MFVSWFLKVILKINLIFGNSQEFPGNLGNSQEFPGIPKTHFFWTHLFKCKKYNEAIFGIYDPSSYPQIQNGCCRNYNKLQNRPLLEKHMLVTQLFQFSMKICLTFFSSLLPSLSYFFSSFHTHLFSFSLIRHFKPEC